jgi:hypothetical protein
MVKQFLQNIYWQKICLIALICTASVCQAGNQKEEQLSNSVKALIH